MTSSNYFYIVFAMFLLSRIYLITKSGSRFSAMALDQNHEQCNAVVKGKRGVSDLFLKDEALRQWLIAQPIIVDLL